MIDPDIISLINCLKWNTEVLWKYSSLCPKYEMQIELNEGFARKAGTELHILETSSLPKAKYQKHVQYRVPIDDIKSMIYFRGKLQH